MICPKYAESHPLYSRENCSRKPLKVVATVVQGYLYPTPIGRSAHSGPQGETGAFRVGALSLPSDRFARFGNPARPGVRTAYFAAFGSWSGVLPKNAESLRNSDALMRVAVPRRRGSAGSRCSVAASCAAPVSFAVRYRCNEGQREKFVNVTVVILFVV